MQRSLIEWNRDLNLFVPTYKILTKEKEVYEKFYVKTL